jgi:hypothetical protein
VNMKTRHNLALTILKLHQVSDVSGPRARHSATDCSRSKNPTYKKEGNKMLNKLKQLFAVLLALALTVGVVLPANAQAAVTATPASVSLSYTIGESLTVSALPASVTFTGATPTTGAITVTTTWVLASTRTAVNVNFGLGSVSAALVNGSNNIPVSKVFLNTNGSAYGNCTQAGGADSTLTGMLVVGAICNNGIAQAITTANDAGSRSDTVTLQLQGLGALPAGTYTGTLTVVADAI